MLQFSEQKGEDLIDEGNGKDGVRNVVKAGTDEGWINNSWDGNMESG